MFYFLFQNIIQAEFGVWREEEWDSEVNYNPHARLGWLLRNACLVAKVAAPPIYHLSAPRRAVVSHNHQRS